MGRKASCPALPVLLLLMAVLVAVDGRADDRPEGRVRELLAKS